MLQVSKPLSKTHGTSKYTIVKDMLQINKPLSKTHVTGK